MRILHTGDWHLGKNLEGYERLKEQEQFIDELVTIVEEQQVQMVIVSGDIYDHSNPPAKAERLFYEALRRLNHKGERIVVIIAGNHDHPERLTASVPLLYEEGIFLLGTFHDVIPAGTYPTFTLHQSGKGYMEIEFQGERVLLLTLPYPSEKRLNEIFAEELQEEAQQKAYSNRIGEVLQELASYYREDTINLCISHLYLRGGAVTDSERPIQLGGSLAVHIDEFPKEAQYIALGHLHRPQTIQGTHVTAHYAGSPIQYSKSEITYGKSVYIADVVPGKKAEVTKVFLRNYKPIEIWRCKNVQEALEKCEEAKDQEKWVYLEIETDRVLHQEEIKSLRRIKKDIVEIIPIFKEAETEGMEYEDPMNKTMKELFCEFYFSQKQVEPTEEMVDLFLSIMQEEGEEDETVTA